jgi:hypothetical protein
MSTVHPATSIRRWLLPTPGKLLLVLLAAEGILLLSNWLQWIPKGWAVLSAVAAVGLFLIGMLLWFLVALIFRWRFQFSIRSLLALTVAVAIPFSWLAVEMKRVRKQEEIVMLIEQAGGSVEYFGSLEEKLLAMYEGRLPEPKWLLYLFGQDFFYDVTFVTLHGATPEHLSRFSQLHTLMFFDVKISNAILLDCQRFSHLKSLTFCECDLDNEGLYAITKIKHLKDLDLTDACITDQGLVYIQELRELESLKFESLKDEVSPIDISNEGLMYLKGLRNLTSLTLVKTKVTDEGVKMLQQALPNCKIEHRNDTRHF